MPQRYRITLTPQDRGFLEDFTKRGAHDARATILARALLLCDAGADGPSWSNGNIAAALGITDRTIEHLKKRAVAEGIKASLERKARELPPRELRFDGDFETRMAALVRSEPPPGHPRWTVRLLSEKIVELHIAESVSHMTVHRVLKKMNIRLAAQHAGKSRPRAMPPL